MSVSAYGKVYDNGLNNCYRLEPSTDHHTMTYSARDAKPNTSNPSLTEFAAWQNSGQRPSENRWNNSTATWRDIYMYKPSSSVVILSHAGWDVQVKGIMMCDSTDHGMTWGFSRWHLELCLDTVFYGELSKHILIKLERHYGSIRTMHACQLKARNWWYISMA